MNIKKSRTARSAAVVLAVVGVAGLSMAAASQLNLGWDGEFQAGKTTIAADCQADKTVGVAFGDVESTSGGALPWSIKQLKFSGIEDSCKTLHYKVDYKAKGSSAWVNLVDAPNLTLATGGVLAVDLNSVDAQSITDVALTILS